MRLRTDDDIYRARLVYLGPPGYTLPIQLPYAQYGLFVLLVPLYMFIHWLFTLKVELLPARELASARVSTSLGFLYLVADCPALMFTLSALIHRLPTTEPRVVQRAPR